MNEEQLDVLTKLRDGWKLIDSAGSDGFGGFLFGGSPKEGYSVPVADMKFFHDQKLIRFDDKRDSYVLTGLLPPTFDNARTN